MDSRNHGSSPWSENMNYEFMAEDLLKFISDLRASDVSLVGHSMGGKAAMTAALMDVGLLQNR